MANIRFEYSGKLSDGRFWDETSNKRVTIELEDNDLSVPEMLEEFMNFMQAIGYKFDLGDRLDVVNDFKDFRDDNKQTNLDFGGLSHTGFGVSDPGFGAVPPDTAS
jgi:hypothetical protein